MKSWLPLLSSMLCVSVALAEPPAPPATKSQSAAAELVHAQLLTPLKKAEAKRSRFSRAAPVAVQRRVRVLDAVALTDTRGKAFVRFAIDERRSRNEQSPWRKDSVVGCAYLTERALFVRRGEAYVPAESLLGKDDEARPDVCRAAPQDSAQIASAATP
jgi:hypothetical protein